jgi:multiple antibiotic resistance protein
MQEAAKNLLLVLVALFPIVDPLGGSPFFLALTREYAPEARVCLQMKIRSAKASACKPCRVA